MFYNIFRKLSYALMKLLIPVAFIYARMLSKIHRLSNHKEIDLGIFLHSPRFSDGYYRRFLIFDEQLKKHNISYDILHISDEREYQNVFLTGENFTKQYLTYILIAWKRAIQVSRASKYKNILVQRSLFPYYPDYKTPVFEKILRKQCDNIILDIWDPVHIWNPDLTYASFNYFDKLTVNTTLLKDDYKKHFDEKKIFLWPIAVEFSKFEVLKNQNDKISGQIKFFYTGSKGNVKHYLVPIIPCLESVAQKFDIELTVVGSFAPTSNKLRIKHFKWSEENIKNAIQGCDFGLYPNFQKQKTKNYTVAGKILDYMSCKLPIIGADQGLPEGIDKEKAILVANNLNDWENALLFAINNNEVMREKAEYSYDFLRDNLKIEQVFSVFLNCLKK